MFSSDLVNSDADIHSVAKSVVAERFGENKVVRKDMLGSFIKNGLTQEEAGSETLLQIIAGSDTTATAIRATLLHLMSSPSAYVALRDEIDAAIAAGKISSPVADAESRMLPYLQAVIKEGLRIWPPVTGLMSKTVPKCGDTLGGIFVPGGTEVGYCAWGLQRIRSIYGEDADVFRPERWLEADQHRLKEMEKTVELVFVYGKWQCPGKNVAAIELNKVFVEVSRLVSSDGASANGVIVIQKIRFLASKSVESMEDLQRRNSHPVGFIRARDEEDLGRTPSIVLMDGF